jgi:hypothetical protein
MRSIWRPRSAGGKDEGGISDREADGLGWDAVVPVLFGLAIGGVVWYGMGAYEGGHDLATGIVFGVGGWLFGRWLLKH